MPNKNSYTRMHNNKVLNGKSSETEIDNCNCCIKDTCPLLNIYQTESIIYQVNIDCDITGYKLDTNENVTLAHVKEHLKSVSEIIKSRSTTLKHKNDTNYEKTFGKLKVAMKYQKLYGK